MKISGEGKKGIFILSEMPSKKEDSRGKACQGISGNMLKRALKKNGINLEKDCWKMHSVSCRPVKTGEATDFQIDCCRKRVWNQLKKLQPKVIILLGSMAIKSFLAHRTPEEPGGISKWRGWVIPDQEVNAWVCPTYHPNYVLYKDKDPVVELIFKQDIERAIKASRKPFPKRSDDSQYVTTLTKPKHIREALRRILKSDCPLMSFDYETTGLKPQRKGHRIYSCSAAVASDECYAWPMDNKNVIDLWCQILESDIKKCAHNAKFEDRWSNVILKTMVKNWFWCSLLSAHIEDNRRGIANLKFQTYVNFGILDYASHISPYLKGVDEKDGNSFNRIHELKIEDCLVYNGLDSLYEHWIACKQIKAVTGVDYA